MQPLKTLKPFEPTWTFGKQSSNLWMKSVRLQKKMIIFCYQEVVIGQSFCPGSSTHAVIGVRTSWNLATQKKQDSGHCCQAQELLQIISL